MSEHTVPPEAVITAASRLEKNWPYGCQIGTTGGLFTVKGRDTTLLFHEFLCRSTDGGYWLVAASRYGHFAHVDSTDRAALEEAAQDVVDENDRKFYEGDI